MIIEFDKKMPVIEDSSFIAGNATLAGDVVIGEDCSVWFSAVLRGDEAPIRVGNRSNIQDNATVHCDRDIPVVIGEDVTIGHNAIIHSCTIGDKTVIGMGAVILSGAKIGEGCIVAAGSVVKSGMEILPGTMVAGTPAVVKKQLGDDVIQKNVENAAEYVHLIKKYKN